MLINAAGLAYFLFPYGNVLATYYLWQKKRADDPRLDAIGHEAFNFQLSMSIYATAGVLLLLVWLGIFILIALCVYQLLAVGLAVLKAHDLEVFEYPLNLRLVAKK